MLTYLQEEMGINSITFSEVYDSTASGNSLYHAFTVKLDMLFQRYPKIKGKIDGEILVNEIKKGRLPIEVVVKQIIGAGLGFRFFSIFLPPLLSLV